MKNLNEKIIAIQNELQSQRVGYSNHCNLEAERIYIAAIISLDAVIEHNKNSLLAAEKMGIN